MNVMTNAQRGPLNERIQKAVLFKMGNRMAE